MTGDREQVPRNTSPYYSYFQNLFDTIDTTSFFWQPCLKAIGSSQLELAGLQARQAQAVMRWTHQVVRPSSPAEIADAYSELWQTLIGNCVEAVPRMMAAASTVTRSVTPIVLPMPERSRRDTLILLDRDRGGEARSQAREERKVA